MELSKCSNKNSAVCSSVQRQNDLNHNCGIHNKVMVFATLNALEEHFMKYHKDSEVFPGKVLLKQDGSIDITKESQATASKTGLAGKIKHLSKNPSLSKSVCLDHSCDVLQKVILFSTIQGLELHKKKYHNSDSMATTGKSRVRNDGSYNFNEVKEQPSKKGTPGEHFCKVLKTHMQFISTESYKRHCAKHHCDDIHDGTASDNNTKLSSHDVNCTDIPPAAPGAQVQEFPPMQDNKDSLKLPLLASKGYEKHATHQTHVTPSPTTEKIIQTKVPLKSPTFEDDQGIHDPLRKKEAVLTPKPRVSTTDFGQIGYYEIIKLGENEIIKPQQVSFKTSNKSIKTLKRFDTDYDAENMRQHYCIRLKNYMSFVSIKSYEKHMYMYHFAEIKNGVTAFEDLELTSQPAAKTPEVSRSSLSSSLAASLQATHNSLSTQSMEECVTPKPVARAASSGQSSNATLINNTRVPALGKIRKRIFNNIRAYQRHPATRFGGNRIRHKCCNDQMVFYSRQRYKLHMQWNGCAGIHLIRVCKRCMGSFMFWSTYTSHFVNCAEEVGTVPTEDDCWKVCSRCSAFFECFQEASRHLIFCPKFRRACRRCNKVFQLHHLEFHYNTSQCSKLECDAMETIDRTESKQGGGADARDDVKIDDQHVNNPDYRVHWLIKH